MRVSIKERVREGERGRGRGRGREREMIQHTYKQLACMHTTHPYLIPTNKEQNIHTKDTHTKDMHTHVLYAVG